MIARKQTGRITMKQSQEEPVGEQADQQLRQQKRPESGQFRLQVDSQTKQSYATYAAAEEAGMAIKKGYPLLQVAVYDLLAGVNKIIELPKAEIEQHC
jgi:hypothetical protein